MRAAIYAALFVLLPFAALADDITAFPGAVSSVAAGAGRCVGREH